MSGETMSIAISEELVTKREHLFVPVDLKIDGYNCLDDQESDWDRYAHIGGGAASLGFTRMVIAHIRRPGSAGGFADTTADTIDVLAANGYQHQGIHSSVNAEDGDRVQFDKLEGGIGCGYMQLRREISQGISQNGREYVDEATRLFPELFDNEADNAYAWQVVGAHEWFSAEPSRIDPGRRVFMTASEHGAEAMLVRGGHAASEGIINTEPGSTLNSNAAVTEGLPCYDFDVWAPAEMLALMPENLDARQAAIANIIDTIGTLKALGVTHIARR
jgi:hypothetical protein